MKKYIFFIAVILFLAAIIQVSYAEDKATLSLLAEDEFFRKGNEYYEKGEYAKAVSEYESILSSGLENGTVYYNLAGAYFKLHKLGKAIVNYERAKCFMPRDSDLAANYRFARAEITGPVILRKGLWAWKPLRIYSEKFTINEFTWTLSVMFILILAMIFIFILRARMEWYQIVILCALCFFMVLDLTVLAHKVRDRKTAAVAIERDAEVLFGPFDSATKFFTLNEGMIVNILQGKDDWYKIKRVDGKVGWVKKQALERVVNNSVDS
ncbi:MAG: SH3 domain-containing protein [Candidatus Omnitrophota bacterium]